MSDDEMSADSSATEVVEEVPEDVSFIAPETLPADNISLVNAYGMRPPLGDVFPIPALKLLMAQILENKLKGKIYTQTDSAKWVREIADAVSTKITETISTPRFKHVVQVHIAQQLGSGCFYMARMCWDADSDDHVAEKYSNTSLFCICTVFGVFQY